MPSKQLKAGLFSVGVINPNLRVFDIVMRTEYGTSYNAYIIKDKKTALFETCHKPFFEEFFENVLEVTKPEEIDYIILSHTEPDHSGAILELLARCPNAKLVCTKAASIYLKNITNDGSVGFITVKDGDVISLGETELKFITAPFLHWPDTMFTYIEKLSAVVTCDFLGAHYCEPRMVDTKITYADRYKYSLKHYFDSIMSPFKPYVRAGLAKLQGLNFDTVLVSHGPVLTKEGYLDYAVAQYGQWSAEKPKDRVSLPIFYCSAYGYTEELANKAAAVLKEKFPAAFVQAYDIIKYDTDALAEIMNGSDGFMIGTPTINKDAVAPVWQLLSRIECINSQKKPVGVFGSYGWSGEAVPAVIGRLAAVKLNVIGEGFKANFCPSEDELKRMEEYTLLFAEAIG